MARIEPRPAALGPVRPPPVTPPHGVVPPFEFVRIVGRDAWISGHRPVEIEGESEFAA